MTSTEEALDLAAIQARADAATPGPWRIDGHEIVGRSTSRRTLQDPWVADVDPVSADADFIAHAREDVTAMLARVEALEAETAKLRRGR